MAGVPIRVSKELRDALGNMKVHKDESYDMVLRRKLSVKRARRSNLKSKMVGFPNFNPGKANNAVMGSDSKATKVVLKF